LSGVSVVSRNITPDYDQPVAGIITRAVERIDETLERVHGCLRKDGRMIFMKGPGGGPEVQEAQERFGGRYQLEADHFYRIGDTNHERRLVIFHRLDAPPRSIVSQAADRHRVVALASEQNTRFKALKKLLTGRGLKKAGKAIVSGARPIEELMGRYPQRCLAWMTSGTSQPPPAGAPAGMEWIQLADPLFQALDIFGTGSPLLLFDTPAIKPWTPDEVFPQGCTLLVPFQDPENIGAVIRSAAAFGVAQVILLAESAHPYHPKALRAAGGTTPHVTLRQGPSIKTLPGDLPIFPLSAKGRDLYGVKFPPAFGLLVGMEGEGVPDRWRRSAVRIPIDAAVESLNAATAAGIALYAWRQKI
jgi:16S rRNA (guanine527-N7)-methyltransferase